MVEVNPGDRFVEMVGTMFGLARDGKVNDRGIPDLSSSPSWRGRIATRW
jgi:hypothetical protein